jgi:glycosyltransferase involved in cell wall biosynthesis
MRSEQKCPGSQEYSGLVQAPLVTVVMCVYNPGEHFRPSLLSILGQTYRKLDILIIDDGSTDGCFESVQDLLADSRIRVFHQENATRPVALNRALDLVQGEFYAVHDADDISHPNRIERQVDALLSRPQLAAVFSGNELIMNGRSLAPTFAPKSEYDCKREIDAFRMPAHDPTGMFRMSLVGDFRYDAALPFVEAFDYVLRVGEQHPMMVLGDCLYGYRILLNSVTRRDPMRREHFVAEALRRACVRRNVDYDQIFPKKADGARRSKNSIRDNNIAAHFMRSVLDQCRAGERFAALRTGLHCVRLCPVDLHYYKAVVYALTPSTIVDAWRPEASTVSFASAKGNGELMSSEQRRSS